MVVLHKYLSLARWKDLHKSAVCNNSQVCIAELAAGGLGQAAVIPIAAPDYDARLGGIPPPADSLLAGCLKSGGMGQAAAAKAHDASKMVHWTTLLDGP
eukprot:CAMPEP_0174359098 /NCGR_PEP_ID=MMETSP0811_2-20130205/46373_1 /TAXON_ID=73025 ORGANISM="Eutreptiella gymnastica-like, Strain CCMP1594" /NCGR_SAMPLE_ID=MMETSP0811_2 /ASSEMBLY_ACC=CAM_ASM_000667 /LENGTH=98 /DNA_ID=CAMNT_0015493417 /DNA_START=266 /DNA_END=559 /DNA_ORIENTATION=-